MEGPEKRPSRPKARQSLAHVPSIPRLNSTEKQNATIDLSAARMAQGASTSSSKKRTRGKSLGPGGLEVLKETDGNTSKTSSVLQPRSILKPTIPLTPPKTIPTFNELRQKSTRKQSPSKTNAEALLIDFSTPGPSHDSVSGSNIGIQQTVFDPFSPAKNPEFLVTGESHDDELSDADRVRQEQKNAILEQRAARRKSLANRRVSFAPEATLHTWSVMEMVEDSTTSSASNSTRRQSSMTEQQTPGRQAELPGPGAQTWRDSSEPSPPAENTVVETHIHQDELQQKRHRRSSVMLEGVDAGTDDEYSSSPPGDVAAESSPIRVEDGADSDSDTDGDTAMSMDDITQNTVPSQSDSDTHSSLEERLRQAASQAGTKGIEYDEYGDDLSMDIAHDTVTNAFQPWVHGQRQGHVFVMDKENINPYSPAQNAHEAQLAADETEENATQQPMMDMTRAVGVILETDKSANSPRLQLTASHRGSSVEKIESGALESGYEDASMDLTTVAGGILLANLDGTDHSDVENSYEDMTMDLTRAIGGLQYKHPRESVFSTTSDDGFMDMTAAVGGILAPIEEHTEPQTDTGEATVAMEMTSAVGNIIPERLLIEVSKQPVENEVIYPVIESSLEAGSSLHIDEQMVANTPVRLTSTASGTGSPSLALKSRSSSRSRSGRISHMSTPRSSVKTTPQKALLMATQSTPTKQMTPIPARARTPERTPVNMCMTDRQVTPKKLFKDEIQAKASPSSTKKQSVKRHDPIFAQDDTTGRQTPRVILPTPKSYKNSHRGSSGIGVDKAGLGSPGVTQLLARRSSIGDAAPEFKLLPSHIPRIRFEDPKQIVLELAVERAEDERRESGRFLMEQEADAQYEENATLQLKDMIESMSPKKNNSNKLKGRKSLAVGSAKGLLGKRPTELDEEDEDGDATPKRLKTVSRDGSPVKRVHLPKPPTKEETTGRLNKAEQKALQDASNQNSTPAINQMPQKANMASSPQQSNRFRDIEQDPSTDRPTSFENKLDNVVGAVDPVIEHSRASKITAEEDKISLQQFLNMTNIHFIELNATKRRHTLAHNAVDDITGGSNEIPKSTAAYFVAAATTMPLLELYQHATKELKSYISTGRKIIKSIESETLAEQPALFREYVDARPDVRLVMDNQFRNGKTNARLQSKEGWYSWRSQLVEGLRAGLQDIRNDLERDLVVVEDQASTVSRTVPELKQQSDSLRSESQSLQRRLDHINSIDFKSLTSSRRDLQSVDKELERKLALLETIQQQMRDKEEALLQAAELRDEMHQQIAEADRVRDEHRGWAEKDVLAAKIKVDDINNRSGWALISAEEGLDEPHCPGVALTISYKDLLRLFFYPAAYGQATDTRRRSSGRRSRSLSGSKTSISLTYLNSREAKFGVQQFPTEQRFFLQFIQSQLQGLSMMPKGSINTQMILNLISTGWDTACFVSEEIRLLNLAGVTRVSILRDESLSVKLMLVNTDRSRVDIEFTTTVVTAGDINLSVSTSVNAVAVYGPAAEILDASKMPRVQTALNKEIANQTLGNGSWIGAVQGFEQWYTSQMRPSRVATTHQQKAEATPDAESAPTGSTTPKSVVPIPAKTPAAKRSPLAQKKASTIQKKIPISTLRQDKLRTSQRDQAPQADKTQTVIQEAGKENLDPFSFGAGTKAPAITPEMQEAMMQRTPIKRVGALRRSPM